METCTKCGWKLPDHAEVCPYCGQRVESDEEKKRLKLRLPTEEAPLPLSRPTPAKAASGTQARGRTILILAFVVLSGLLSLGLAFTIMLWTTSTGAPPKLVVSPGSLDYGTLQVGSQSSQVLTLSNNGKQDLNWSANKGGANWLTLDPSQGRITDGESQTIYVRADTTQLTAGRYSASVSFTSGGGGASVNAVLIVATRQLPPGAPVVSAISPTSGPAAGGMTVTIRGSDFTGASQVLFGTATSTFTVNSDTQITVVSPVGSGTVHVTVITPKGTSATSIADQFTYQGAPPIPPIPTVASMWPASGPVVGGTKVTITGTGFIGVSKVQFGATAASFTVNTDKQITAISPKVTTSGTVDVRVITPGGASNPARFKYYVPVPLPTVGNISPPSGPVAGGTRVTITGTDLSGASKVQFGATAASFTVNTDKQITAVTPAHTAGWVDVTVTTPGGTSKISIADRFTYLSQPVAHAGADQRIMVGSSESPVTVMLDGSGSRDPGGKPLTYQWTQTDGLSVRLSDSTAVKPTFTAPYSATSLTFQLVVSNGQTRSDPDTVIITVTPIIPPVADAGADQRVDSNSTVTLDGSGSKDPGGKPLIYAWTQIGDGTSVTLFDSTSVKPSFTAPDVETTTTLTFQLVVSNGTTRSSPDTVTITVTPIIPPVAHAGADQTVRPSPHPPEKPVVTVTLDGSDSKDPGGKPLTYRWTQIATPGTPTVRLDDPKAVKPSFTAPDVETILTFQLVVSNGTTRSSPDTVTIYVSWGLN